MAIGTAVTAGIIGIAETRVPIVRLIVIITTHGVTMIGAIVIAITITGKNSGARPNKPGSFFMPSARAAVPAGLAG